MAPPSGGHWQRLQQHWPSSMSRQACSAVDRDLPLGAAASGWRFYWNWGEVDSKCPVLRLGDKCPQAITKDRLNCYDAVIPPGSGRRGQRETESRRKSCPITNRKIASWQAVFRTIDE